MPIERAIMALTLSTWPQWRTIHELAREIGHQGILTRCVIELVKIGLLESHGSAVRPTKAAVHLERLKLP